MLSSLYLKIGGAVAIVATILGIWFYIGNLKDDKAALQNELLLANAAIKQQNDGIDALKKESEARVKAAEVKIAAAKAETVKAKNKATVIYKVKPSDPNNLCKSALDLVNGRNAE